MRFSIKSKLRRSIFIGAYSVKALTTHAGYNYSKRGDRMQASHQRVPGCYINVLGDCSASPERN
uniref:Secreted protein n=1 Tax=Hymenolepis diminuta TaxID=6216 RepID=A0A0R3S940_HYMDI